MVEVACALEGLLDALAVELEGRQADSGRYIDTYVDCIKQAVSFLQVKCCVSRARPCCGARLRLLPTHPLPAPPGRAAK